METCMEKCMETCMETCGNTYGNVHVIAIVLKAYSIYVATLISFQPI